MTQQTNNRHGMGLGTFGRTRPRPLNGDGTGVAAQVIDRDSEQSLEAYGAPYRYERSAGFTKLDEHTPKTNDGRPAGPAEVTSVAEELMELAQEAQEPGPEPEYDSARGRAAFSSAHRPQTVEPDSAPELIPVFRVEPGPDDEFDEDSEGGAPAMARVLVIDRVGQLAGAISRVAASMSPAPEIFRVDRATQLEEVVEDEDPDVLVVGSEDVTSATMKRLAHVHRARPRLVILLSDTNRTWTPAQMAASGASDVLPANPTKARLRAKLAGALEIAEQLRADSVVVTERVVIQQAPAPVASTPAPEIRTTHQGRVFTVASASGGCGKTFVSTNLAAYLAKSTGGKVLLIDLDMQFGEVAVALHLHPARTIEDLVRDLDELPESLDDYLVAHAAGFTALCAPTDPLAGEGIAPSQITEVLEKARAEFDYIVIDTPPNLNESCLAAFDQSEMLLVMANMDVPSLKNMRRYLETLEKLDVPQKRTSLILNRADTGTGIELKGIEPLFPQGFSAVLSTSKQVPWSINMGVPILHGEPKAEITKQLAEGFMKLVPPVPSLSVPWTPVTAQPAKRSGLKGLMKGRN